MCLIVIVISLLIASLRYVFEDQQPTTTSQFPTFSSCPVGLRVSELGTLAPTVPPHDQ